MEALNLWYLLLNAFPTAHAARPKKFECAQIATLLLLKARPEMFLVQHESHRKVVLSYRQIVAVLRDSNEFRKALAMKRIPHYSTLAHAESAGLLEQMAAIIAAKTTI